MAYCTLADLLERIPEETIIQLTDDTDSGLVDQSKVDAAIARADEEINAWCGRRYLVPFPSVPAVVPGLSADMALYFLYGRTVDEIPEARKDGYKNAVRLLEKISSGQISLGVAAVEEAGQLGAEFSGPGRLFSRDSLRGV